MTEEDLRRKVARNLAYYRRQMGLTQTELSERINYSDKSVSKWERAEGIPDLYVLTQLADIFCVSVEDLLIIQVGDGRRDLNDQVSLVENNNYYYDEGEDEEEKPVRTRTHYKRQEPQAARPTIDRREIAGSTEAPRESSAPAPVAVPSGD